MSSYAAVTRERTREGFKFQSGSQICDTKNVNDFVDFVSVVKGLIKKLVGFLKFSLSNKILFRTILGKQFWQTLVRCRRFVANLVPLSNLVFISANAPLPYQL